MSTKLHAEPDPTPSAPGTRVYHEYMVSEAADAERRWHWSCNVYGPGGMLEHHIGVAPTRAGACQAAIDWATAMKKQVRADMAAQVQGDAS